MEASEIEHLEKSTTSRLRSGIAIDSVTQCIDELVTNSIDASATCIAVRINIGILKFQVVDNGCGLTEDQLSIIGERYATSKCNKLSDLERLEKFGFRGEALASLRDLSSILEIESKAEASSKTFNKVFSNSIASKIFQGKKERASQGTTITVHSLFHNLPVRQKRVIETLELESVRHRLASIALIHPKISFSLRDDSSSNVILQTRRTGSIKRSFASLFSERKSCFLKEVKCSTGLFSIEGLIGTEGHHNKKLQFMYVNGRLLLKTKLHKLVNTLLGKSLITAKKSWQGSEKQSSSFNTRDNSSSPGKATDQYGVFILDIRCPLTDYEITLDPRKTLVEFKEWEKVIGCCTQLINEFLIQENLTMAVDMTAGTDSQEMEEDQFSPSSKYDLHKEFAYCSGVERYGKGISTESCTSTLQSQIVKRPSTSQVPICDLRDIVGSDVFVSTDESNFRSSLSEDNHSINVNSQCVEEIDSSTDESKDLEPNITPEIFLVNSRSDSTPKTCIASEESTIFEGPTEHQFRPDTKTASEENESDGNGGNRLTSAVNKKQINTSYLIANGQEIVQELDLLEKDCYKNSSELPEPDFNFKDASVGCNTTSSTTQQSQSCELHRISFQEFSGRDALEDLEKMDADSQEGIEEEIVCGSTIADSPEQEIGYTNSLQLFKQTLCKPSSEQPLLTLKLRQEKTNDYAQIAKQKEPTITRNVPVTRANFCETRGGNLSQNSNDETSNFKDCSSITSKFNEPKYLTNKFFKRRQDVQTKCGRNQMQITSLQKLHEYKRKVTFPQSVMKKCSGSYDESSVASKIHRSMSTDSQTSIDGKHSRFFSSSQVLSHHKILPNKRRQCHMTSSQQLQAAQKRCNVEVSDVNQGRSNVGKKRHSEDRFMSSSQFMETAQKIVGKGRLSLAQDSSEHLKAPKFDTFLVSEDIREVDHENLVAVKNSEKKSHEKTSDLGNLKEFDNAISKSTNKPLECRSIDVCIQPGVNSSDCENYEDIQTDNRTLETHTCCIPLIETDMQHRSTLSDTNVHNLSTTMEDISESDSVYNTADDMVTPSEDQLSSGAVDHEVLIISDVKENFDGIEKMSTRNQENSSADGNVRFAPNFESAQSHEKPVICHGNAGQENIESVSSDNSSEDNSSKSETNTTEDFVTKERKEQASLMPFSTSSDSSTNEFNVSQMSPSSVSHQNIPDNVTDDNISGWFCHFDQRLGKKVYVNQISGNSQIVEPQQNDSGRIIDLKRAHRFLTHNATPFLPRSKKQRQSFNPHGILGEDDESGISATSIASIENMVEEHLNELDVDIACKWKDTADLTKLGSGFDNLISHLDSESIYNNVKEKDVVTVCVGDARRSAVRVHNAMHQYNFTKEMLSNIEILGQLDNKFIASMMSSQGRPTGAKPNLLVLIDQHAAHERVRLERLTADAIESDKDEMDEINVISSKVNPPIIVELSCEDMQLIHGFQAKFAKIGIQLKCNSEDSVQVTSVPTCFIEHDASEVRHARKPVTDKVVETLIKEQLTLWTQTLGASATLPQTVVKVLKSQACHGAIKFGDALTLTECQDLVSELSKCDLPFQCAHGRPSLMPILDFDLMRSVPDTEESSTPCLWRLKRARSHQTTTELDEHESSE